MTNIEAAQKLERQKAMICQHCIHPQSVRWCEEHCMLPEAFDMATEALKEQDFYRQVTIRLHSEEDLNKQVTGKLNSDQDPAKETDNKPADDDAILRRDAIDIVHKIMCKVFNTEEGPMSDTDKLLLTVNKAICNRLKSLPATQSIKVDAVLLRRSITAAIIATNKPDLYSCGMRNGMRWCRAFLEDEYPKFEDASKFAQPEIIHCKDCMYKELKGVDYYCDHITGEEIMVSPNDYCSWGRTERSDE